MIQEQEYRKLGSFNRGRITTPTVPTVEESLPQGFLTTEGRRLWITTHTKRLKSICIQQSMYINQYINQVYLNCGDYITYIGIENPNLTT